MCYNEITSYICFASITMGLGEPVMDSNFSFICLVMYLGIERKSG